MDGGVPILSTYACTVGQSLPASNHFVTNLSNYFRVILQREQGQLNLNNILLNLPEALGTCAFSEASEDVILFGRAQPIDYTPSTCEKAFTEMKKMYNEKGNENLSLKTKVESLAEQVKLLTAQL